MGKQKSASRRDFLRHSSVAALASLAGPGSFPIIASSVASVEPAAKSRGAETGVDKNATSPHPVQSDSRVWEYATLEGMCDGIPVWSFSNLCYIYGVSPELQPGVVMQQGNIHPLVKIQPKKSWEIKYNLLGSTHERTVRTAYNESLPMLPIHLIDGDPNTIWSSWEFLVPDARPEWIRIDLPVERQVASVALVCAKDFHYGDYGKALPKELEVKTSRDAWHWETVYTNKDVAVDQMRVEIRFEPRAVRQIWIVANNFPKSPPRAYQGGKRHMFSIGEVQVREPGGTNVALISRGASVTVSSTSYVELGGDRLSADALWGPLQYDLGNKWVRFGIENASFTWPYVEHEKGRLEIDRRADESVTECVRNGIDVILALDFKGNWIYESPPRKTNWLEARYREINDAYNDPVPAADANPEMYQGYLRYVEYMVRHFKDRVAYFEIGNEWNSWFGTGHYLRRFFEPTYQIIKHLAPNAKVMLGGVGLPEFDQRNAILECLGKQPEAGAAKGKLLLEAGALAIRNGIQARDMTISVDGENKGQSGVVLRYREKNYLAAIYGASDHAIMIDEVVGGSGLPLAVKKIPDLGPNLHFDAKLSGSSLTFTVSDGNRSASANYTVRQVNDSGAAGLIHYAGDGAQSFDHFIVEDALGEVLVKDEFNDPDGAIPAMWSYVSGGPNPVKKGLGTRIDAIGCHPVQLPTGAYFDWARTLQKECRELGFKGKFFATEIYADAIYPPGPPRTSTEEQMANQYARSVVGHSGLGMGAGPCHPYLTSYAHPVALCQPTWPMETLNPCRPTMAYYLWRTIATTMDDFHPAEFPVIFSEERGLLFFKFRRGDNERMVSVWIDYSAGDIAVDALGSAYVVAVGTTEAKSDIIFPGVKAHRATVVDIMNGTEQELDLTAEGEDTIIRNMLVKDYPVFVKISQ